jgi:hypothetical protein
MRTDHRSRGRVREKNVAIGHETVMPMLSPQVRYEGMSPTRRGILRSSITRLRRKCLPLEHPH